MASNAYRFVTHWRFHATIVEIADIFEDTASLARWWPSVYLDVKVLEPGTGHGLGKVVDLLTKGYLPYTLRWKFRVVEENYPHGSRLGAIGDFVGTGIWTFVQDGDYADITYEWTVRAEKPLLRSLSWLLKPIFSANHHWAMARGAECLAVEIERRRTVPWP